MDRAVSNEAGTVLKGTTLEVYRFLLKNGKPVGVRGVQRALNLSSPSLAVYHLTKLEEAGLLSRERGDYVVNRVVLDDVVKVSRFLIPRFLFYALFALAALMLDLTVFKPSPITSSYFFTTAVILGCTVAFFFETVRKWRKGAL